jgi:MOSC domain-containing protein YiiM
VLEKIMTSGKILAIFVGRPKTYGTADAKLAHDRLWTSSIVKELINGPVRLGETNLAGDQQADLSVHGGPDKAVNVYSADHYPLWQAELNLPDFGYGAFGENLVVAGLTEDAVCIDDLYRVGEATVQVSQPRGPCWKIARRWRMKDLTARVDQTGRTGWYLRVLQPGFIEAGQTLELIERPYPEMTITKANQS